MKREKLESPGLSSVNFLHKCDLLKYFSTFAMKFHILMPHYLHIPHTPDTAQALTLSGRNCLVVSGMTTPPS